ncbi:MAG: sodium:calcium antiporter [Halobacteria archaeon]|nr:sodium:calcium antiporter [Halobacteria archaeon]
MKLPGFLKHPLVPLVFSVLLTLPWIYLNLTGNAKALGNLPTVGVAGLSILGAAFLLTWAAETAEKDVPRSFALAVLAIIAVAPEYAVDAFYAWQAGANPGSAASMEAAGLAVANMTGANRILIGLGWSGIAIYSIYRLTQAKSGLVEQNEGFLNDKVKLTQDISLEIFFLAIATLYAFFVPLNGALDVIDMVILVGIYFVYIFFALQSPPEEEEAIGVPGYLQSLAAWKRIPAIILLFLFSAIVILVAVEPFARGLEHLGMELGVSKFFMIQWVAPLASETPELIVVAYLVNKARSTAAFQALISSKLNQWMLLIGTLVVVYSISLGTYGQLPLDHRQMGEIWITAAKSFFAVAILVNFKISMREALALLILFIVQLHPWFHHYEALLGFSALYMVLGTVLLLMRLDSIQSLFGMVIEEHFWMDIETGMDNELETDADTTDETE